MKHDPNHKIRVADLVAEEIAADTVVVETGEATEAVVVVDEDIELKCLRIKNPLAS